MMEYKGPKTVKTESSQSGTERSSGMMSMDSEFKGKSKEPAPELLDRLAFGKKAKVFHSICY